MELSWLYFIIGVATELLTVLLKAWFEFDECVISTLVASLSQHSPYFFFFIDTLNYDMPKLEIESKTKLDI